MKKTIVVLSAMLLCFHTIQAQEFTHADTLRGSNGPGRSWWNATKYDLHVDFNLNDSTIQGYNVISYQSLNNDHAGFFQIDLQEPMQMDSAILETGNPQYPLKKEKLSFTRDGNAFFVYLPAEAPVIKRKHDINTMMPTSKNASELTSQKKDSVSNLVIYYHGKPRIAKKAPWDGGFVYSRDKSGNPWVGVACQGFGASVWYPCKDYQADEPDSAEMHFAVPANLMCISNGRLRNIDSSHNEKNVYTWAVVNPINNYDITFYIGRFVHFGQIYDGEKGPLTMDYWVLDSNLAKAKKQFRDAARMMKAFEYWFGPYPFYEDGYKLVDAPYLGMEHQSGIAYGNHYENGYLGRDLSQTGWGLKWDFIIVHESAHEWFGNNITSKDLADMWVHEAFANYAEALFTDYYYGKKAGDEYVIGVRKNIVNDKPVIAHYGVNEEGSGDMYYKGGNMLHTIRQVINNDEKFRKILRGLNKTFYHQTVTGKEVEQYINKESGIDFTKVFQQYLTTTDVPVLVVKYESGKPFYKWANCVDGFDMPLKINNQNGKSFIVHPTDKFRSAPKGVSAIQPDDNYFVNLKVIK
ncbi:MAG: M1 family metallopeptidase [Ginsengibacter sp.]